MPKVMRCELFDYALQHSIDCGFICVFRNKIHSYRGTKATSKRIFMCLMAYMFCIQNCIRSECYIDIQSECTIKRERERTIYIQQCNDMLIYGHLL